MAGEDKYKDLSEEDRELAEQVEQGIIAGRERVRELRGEKEPTGHYHTGLGSLVHIANTLVVQYPEIITDKDKLQGDALEASRKYENVIEELNRRGSQLRRSALYFSPIR